MMTGMYQTSIGAHHHRSHRGDGYQLPRPVRPITHYLQEAGYYCAIGCGYGGKTDLNFKTPRSGRPLFDGKDWSKRKPGQPFFAQIQLKVTHRGTWWKDVREESADPVDPQKVQLPPYLPDRPSIRLDWAMYLDQLERADAEVGDILQRLEEEGIADSTVVIFIGDNGRCVHRGKGFLYEDGIKVPCIISWPGKIAAGTVNNDLISTIDLSAQILALAGVEVPSHMQGREFMGTSVRPREFVFSARDRWDEVVDKSRAVVSKKYKYIRNDMPEVPYFTHQDYLERVRPIRSLLWELHVAGKLTATQEHLMSATKPQEELYDLERDPWETTNLAGEAEFRAVLDEMRRGLESWEEETNDLGRVPETASSRGKKVSAQIAERTRQIEETGRQ